MATGQQLFSLSQRYCDLRLLFVEIIFITSTPFKINQTPSLLNRFKLNRKTSDCISEPLRMTTVSAKHNGL